MTFDELVTGFFLLGLIFSLVGYNWCCNNVFLKSKKQKVGDGK